MKNLDYLLNWNTAYEWAKTQNPHEKVGTSRNVLSCPFANCFASLEPDNKFEVTLSRIQIDDEGRIITPYGMSSVIEEIDHLYDDEDDGVHEGPVTAKEFVEILEKHRW